jgi:hypothetical protein
MGFGLYDIPRWFQKFRADGFFACPEPWEDVYGKDEPQHGPIRKWLTLPYSAWLNVKKNPVNNQR